jgi:hypothetical protein
MTNKKKMLLAGVLLLLGGAAAAYKPVAATAKAKEACKDLPSCQASCSSPCFCNRSCFITWCWGPWYCQCG